LRKKKTDAIGVAHREGEIADRVTSNNLAGVTEFNPPTHNRTIFHCQKDTIMRMIPFLLLTLLQMSRSVNAQQSSDKSAASGLSTSMLSGLEFRSIGPALTSGRIIDIAVDPTDHARFFVAVASGGVWRTLNAGVTWEPVFDGEASYSIGCITMDPNNPYVLWVGSGENNSQRSVSYGDGVYKSEDGGSTWKNMGLKTSEHIGKIIVDPRNSDVVYVAAQGPLWASGGERGLYKTMDGGVSWKAVLTVSKYTGVSDIVMDPRNPDVLYAASYQRARTVWTLIDGGPESAIYKSSNAGTTWTKLERGLPSGDVGRIGLAISPVNPDVLFATIELPNRKGGFYRSGDRGASWEKRSGYINGSPQYYTELVPDPVNLDRVYAMDTYLKVTDDGGKTFRNLGEKNKHVDNHAMWVNPKDPKHYRVGCDGGLYESYDTGSTWFFFGNLPITQFYRVSVDNALPFYNVYGGTQDNFTLGGPSRTRSASGITNADWFVTVGGDGFGTQVDPEDPNIVYSQSQYGNLARFDKRNGEIMGIKPVEGKGEKPYRWNWDSPLLISPHKASRLYFAGNILFQSDDRGNTWKAISGDLTRQIDRNTLEVMDKVWGIDAVAKNASTSLYGTCIAVSESPVKEGTLYVGTDDGLIQRTTNGGASWTKTEKFPDVPAMTYVSDIVASQHDVYVVYAAFDNHKSGDFAPYLLKSVDGGESWSSIAATLPKNGPVYCIVEDHEQPQLLFCGTEYGVFCTIDGGNNWVQMKGGLPTIAVKEIAIQKRENDLVLGTFGRGFYILDNYSPLRKLNKEVVTAEASLFPVKDALVYHPSQPYGLKGKAFQGASFFTSDNPPHGAILTYYLKEAYKTLKDKRKDSEKEAEKRGEKVKYPTYAELKAEDDEDPPAIILTIADETGSVVRRLSGPISKGIHRVNWDMRYPSSSPVELKPSEPDIFATDDGGPLSMPGKYTARLSKMINGLETQLGTPQSFSTVVLGPSTLEAGDREKLVAFQRKVADLQRAVLGSKQVVDDAKTRLTSMKRALLSTAGATGTLQSRIDSLEEKVNNVFTALSGDKTLSSRFENTPPAIGDRVNSIIDDQWLSTSAPTQTQVASYGVAADEFEVQLSNLKTLVDVDLKKIENELDRLGAPWTPGRIPEWKKK